MAAPKTEYQSTVALFATNIEGVLSKIESGQSCILRSNINILRTVIAFIAFKLGSNAGGADNIDQRGLFSLDAELHRIQSFLLQLAVEDSNLVNATQALPAENKLARGLRLLKILINLSKFRVTYLHDSSFIFIDVMNSIGLIQPPLHIPPNAQDDTIKDKVLKSFMDLCSSIPSLSDNDTLDLELSFETADSYDCERISTVFAEIDDIVGNNLNTFKQPDDIGQILNQFRKIAKSSKVGMLLKQTLKVGDDFLEIIDEEIFRLVFEKNEFTSLVDVNMTSPNNLKVLGEGLMGRVIVGKVGQQAAAFKSLGVSTDILKTVHSEGRNELLSELRLKWLNYNNENILSLHGVTLIDDKLIIAYELMQSDLETVLHHKSKKQVLSEDACVEIMLAIFKGLKFLHLTSTVHANLHPGNVLLRGLDNYGKMQLKDLRVKLSDFGTQALKNDLTKAAQLSNPLLGIKIKTTKAYLAPEVLSDEKFTYASDIYAAGVIGWELGQDNGRPLNRVPDLEKAVVTERVRPDLANGSYKDWIKGFIQECWAHEPWERPSAQDAQRRIEQEINHEQAQNSSMRDFRGRPIQNSAAGMPRIALPSGGASISMQRQSGSRLSRVRMSTQRANVRPSSQARTSVVLQKQRFAFLDNINGDTKTDVGIKILKAMRFYMTDAELQVKGLVGLRLILEGGMNRQKVVGRMGAGLLAIKAMQNHMKEVAVVEPAIGLIGNLSADFDVAESLMKSGAAQAIVAALRKHGKDDAIAEETLIALTNLHQGDVTRQRFLINLDIPYMILELMKKHYKSPSLLSEGFAAISYLHGGWYANATPCSSLIKQNKKDYKKEGKRHWQDFFDLKAQDVILSGIKLYKENKDVQAEGFSALAVVVAGFDERRKNLIRSKFLLPHLAKMMDRYHRAPELVEASFALISQITCVKSCHKEVLALNIHEYIIEAMQNFTEELDESLQIGGIRALYHLAHKDKKTSKILKNGGAIEAAIRARTLFPQNDELVKAADALSLIIARGGRS